MILGRFTLAMLVLTAPAVWGQHKYSKADMMKLAEDRFETASRALKLSPDQAAAIKPLIETKYVYIGQIKDVYIASAKTDASNRDASKKTAKESLKTVDTKYNGQIVALLKPEQMKDWKKMQKDWKDDVSLPKAF
jgi:hypothetical protein